MARKLILDSSSIINFLRYYYFDKNSDNIINAKLNNFIMTKIANHEILVIDKVFNELHRPETIDIKKKIKKDVIDSVYLFPIVENLIDDYYIKSNERFLGNDPELIETEISKYEDTYADLYLIALCMEILKKNNKVILISEETLSRDDKLIKKIPTICRDKKIKCEDLPFMLFSIYKDELIFDLEAKN
ncbi:MAG: DUF4411 family protein [Candidatus Cloacimonetes bacterium]|nr:DUF4411 family protein [Candidatus Cloacimonadota bacterium]